MLINCSRPRTSISPSGTTGSERWKLATVRSSMSMSVPIDVQLLQASCKIHRVAMHRVIESTAGPHVAGDDFSGRDANTGTQ